MGFHLRFPYYSMEAIYLERLNQVRKLKSELENKLEVKVEIKGHGVVIDGPPLNEFVAKKVFDAINFGFSVPKAIQLRHEDIDFKIIRIKDHTKRNLRAVKSRLIGTHGKTRKTISDIADCDILIKESEVGVIAEAEYMDNVSTAIIKIIKGSKQSNSYKYLERMNRAKKESSPI
jgi:ribosomal RNA assembly protein